MATESSEHRTGIVVSTAALGATLQRLFKKLPEAARTELNENASAKNAILARQTIVQFGDYSISQHTLGVNFCQIYCSGPDIALAKLAKALGLKLLLKAINISVTDLSLAELLDRVGIRSNRHEDIRKRMKPHSKMNHPSALIAMDRRGIILLSSYEGYFLVTIQRPDRGYHGNEEKQLTELADEIVKKLTI